MSISSRMKNEVDIKTKLDEIRSDHIHAINNKLVWSSTDRTKEIRTLEWVISVRDEL